MKLFTRRLRTVMRAGDLSVTDLANWFDRPFHTVRWWALGKTPVGAGGRDAVFRLGILERQFGLGKLPVPPRLTWRLRTEYISNMKNKAFGDEPAVSRTYLTHRRRVHRLVKTRPRNPAKDVLDDSAAMGVDRAAE